MSYDPTKPVEGTLCDAAEMRSQLNALKALIDAISSVTGAITQNTGTLPPGSSATADVTFSGGILTFTCAIPAGAPGEVTQAQLSNDLSNTANQAMLNTLPQTSAKLNNAALLTVTSGDFLTQTLVDKMNKLINSLRW